MKNGQPTAHINTFGRNDLLANETNTMGDELFLAARKAFYSRIGAKMQVLWESPIREQNISVELGPRVVGKLKVRWNRNYGRVKGRGGVNGWVGGVMGLKGGVSGSRIGICTSVRGLRNGFGGVHGGWAGVRVGGGEEGWKVFVGRNIKWGGIIYLVVREGRGDYAIRGGVRGLVIRAEAASVLGLRVISGVYIEARGAREAS